MNRQQLMVREQRLKAQKRLMIVWVTWFLIMPVILHKDWKTASDLGASMLVVCIVGYIAFGTGFFCLFLCRYRKIAAELGKRTPPYQT
jgi:hypothetical protein